MSRNLPDIHSCHETDNIIQFLMMSNEAFLNTSCNMSRIADERERYPDAFTKSLADEGLLTYCNPISKIPVLSVCHGFLDAELAATNFSYQDEKRYRNSIQHLSQDKQENYMRLFSAHYPLEPLVDGLPGSVWLECVEPTLSILKALNLLKRRKSNLSIKKCSMSTVDSNVASRGDFEHVPHVFNPFVNGNHHRLLRVQFFALEGTLNVQSRNNQNSLLEVQEGRHPLQPVQRNTDVQRRRRLRQYRPYDVPQDVIRAPNHFENSYELGEIINNFDFSSIDIRGI